MEKEAWHLSQFIVTWLSDKNAIGVTVVSHDSENRSLVQGCGHAGCYQRDIHYTGANFLHLGNLTTVSAYCEQFIKYEYFGSMIFRSKFSWWVSRDGDQMTYWGGCNSTYPYKCACGVSGTCAFISYGCNCDIRMIMCGARTAVCLQLNPTFPSSRFKESSGYLGQRGYHTLGKLRCYGITSK